MSVSPALGVCRCGATRIEVSAEPLMTAVCHCTGCQKMSASAFSLTAMVPAGAFRVVQGVPVRGGAKTPGLDHMFCPDCLTWMFTRLSGFEGADSFVNARATMFDRPDWCVPFLETMTDEKLPWVSTPAQRSYAGFPGVEDFAGLVGDYAASRA
ncbi:GFA family protein [Salipiger sp. P9]|uniref:GFA family protein n=1 Tax=Salipiger pentaromativorans TaxID=2943193 RepID=UPI002156F746|nr:GFA family protein [Salipiger pentaromativorans]MCR8547907.1 GFA family protein [Salipiger pentaromativorans]